MKIAVEGCAHGELDRIYETVLELERRNSYKVDLLICCGDFQAVRNHEDLECMAVPMKFRSLCTFYKYYSGEKVAPILTLFIGGNHEASNFLAELPYGGWVAPNIYYMGFAGVVQFSGLRIGGISGIFKGIDYLKGHFEKPPYTSGTLRSVYHVRQLEVFRLKQIGAGQLDIMFSHDWPRGVTKFGDEQRLFRIKPFFREEAEQDVLGSRPSQELLNTLKPRYWFAGHLHVKFPASIHHADGSTTEFLALDKCLPRRDYLQIVEVQAPERQSDSVLRLEYDAEWLAILKSTDHLTNITSSTTYMPGPNCGERWDFRPAAGEVKAILELFSGVNAEHPLEISPSFFHRTAPPLSSIATTAGRQRLAAPTRLLYLNPQTSQLCTRLGITNPNALMMSRFSSTADQTCNSSHSNVTPHPKPESFRSPADLNVDELFFCDTSANAQRNPDEIRLDVDDVPDDDDFNAPDELPANGQGTPMKREASTEDSERWVAPRLKPSLTEAAAGLGDIRAESTTTVLSSSPNTEPPLKKQFKRRNESLYATVVDDD